MEHSEKVYRSRAKMLLDNFLGGIVWSLGVWIGTTVIIAIIIYLLSRIDLVPFVGDFVGQVTQYVANKNPLFPF